MADATSGQVDQGFPWKALARPLGHAARARLARSVRALLGWQRSLAGWPRALEGANATPFVSLYARGRLRGCFGSNEGDPGERLARAFLRALEDARFGPMTPAERAELEAQAAYLHSPRPVSVTEARDALEPGTHGVAFARPRSAPVLLLPQVARDGHLGAAGMLEALARKAQTSEQGLAEGQLFLFESDDVVVRQGDGAEEEVGRDGVAAGARWLAGLVRPDGSLVFAVDPRKRQRQDVGAMHHGRAAVVVQALAAHGGYARRVGRARRRLTEDIRRALAGGAVAGWPPELPTVAGTLALAVLAGVAVRRELCELVAQAPSALEASPWHAAQVVAALGRDAPEALWASCIRDLARRPWSPWTAIAANARGDASAWSRTASALVDSVRSGPPHVGGAGVTPIPECALTAIVAEALGPAPGAEARAAAARARAFLRRWQLGARLLPAALDPELALGAFPLSPVVDILRGDVTGHALLALLPGEPARTVRA